MTLAEYSMLAFALLNGGRVVAYFPQMITIYRDTNGAHAVSLSTWAVFAVTNAATVCYALAALNDRVMALVFALNTAFCVAIAGMVAAKRARHRWQQSTLRRASRPSLRSFLASKPSMGIAQAALLALACEAIAIHGAAAQPYPAKPIKMISPFSVGGPPDTLARLVGQKLSERLGINITIENRPGAGTTLATRAAAAADPDGYTLLQVNATLAYAPVLYPEPGYDPVKSFAPVATLATWSHFLFVAADVPANTVEELVAYARLNPGKVNIGHPVGVPPQVLAEIFKTVSGASFNSIPYRQAAQLRADLLGGRIQAYFSAGAELVTLVQQGKLKALVYTGMERYPDLPQVPTAVEAGLPQLALNPSDWTGIVAPAGTPPDVISALNAAINEILHAPEVRANITRQGGTVKLTSPSEFAEFVAAEAKKWPPLVTAAKLKAD
jgi:tripartite-type tricarboxylate transporter receptor subunit TctC